MKIAQGDLALISSTIEELHEVKRFEDVSACIFDFLKKYTSFNMAIIYKIDKQDQHLKIISCLGTDILNLKKRAPFKIGEGAVGKAAFTKKPILVRDALKDTSIGIRQFYHEDPLIRSFIAVPFISRGEVKGMLSVSSSKADQYNPYDVKLISIIASQGALLLELNNKISSTTALSNAVIENISNGVILTDSQGVIISANKAAENITGYEKNSLLGAHIHERLKFDILHGSSRRSVDQIKEDVTEVPGFLQTSDYKTIELKASISFVCDSEQEEMLTICMFRDTTELNLIEKQMRHSDRLAAVGRMTASITHEIRNPLLPIRNASEFLYQKYGRTDDELGTMLGIIVEECERLNQLTNKMAALYRTEDTKVAICDPVEVALKVVGLLKYALLRKAINIKTDFISNSICIGINADHFKQLLINLLLNSMDALCEAQRENKEIHFEIGRERNFCTVSIWDNGTGISEENIEKIFDPFFTTKENGTGMGLATAANFIDKAGGRIDIKSAEGEYTQIVVKLPIRGGKE